MDVDTVDVGHVKPRVVVGVERVEPCVATCRCARVIDVKEPPSRAFGCLDVSGSVDCAIDHPATVCADSRVWPRQDSSDQLTASGLAAPRA